VTRDRARSDSFLTAKSCQARNCTYGDVAIGQRGEVSCRRAHSLRAGQVVARFFVHVCPECGWGQQAFK